MIVVVGGVKGGSGKTTIATNLAVMRSQDGNKVLLVDADEQESAFTFAAQRDAMKIPTEWTTIKLAGKTLHSQINRIIPDYDDIIVDVGGRDTSSQRSALVIADVFLIPFKPCSYDVWTIGDVNVIISEVRSVNPRLKAFAFINQADAQGHDNKESQDILKESSEFSCLNLTIGNRKSFRNSSSNGLGVTELKSRDSKATNELQELYENIYQFGI